MFGFTFGKVLIWLQNLILIKSYIICNSYSNGNNTFMCQKSNIASITSVSKTWLLPRKIYLSVWLIISLITSSTLKHYVYNIPLSWILSIFPSFSLFFLSGMTIKKLSNIQKYHIHGIIHIPSHVWKNGCYLGRVIYYKLFLTYS